jgi:hypothetical protein
MCFKTETSNGELPVENVGAGDGTVIMGHSNPHLSVRKAMGCPIARSYFVKAFDELSDADKEGFITSTDLRDFAILTAMVVDDFSGITMFAYMEANSMENAQNFITFIAGKVVAQIGETEDAHKAFAGVLDEYYTSTWLPVIRADKAAERAEKRRSGVSNGDAELAELLKLLTS